MWEAGRGQEVTTYSLPLAIGDLRAAAQPAGAPRFRVSRNPGEQRGLWRWKEGGQEALTNFPTLHPPRSQGKKVKGRGSQFPWG